MKRVLGEAKYLESGIFLSGRCDENWYHFIIDTVPRILFVSDIPIDVPLLIRSDIPLNSKAVLAAITEREIIEIEPSEIFEVQNLYVVPARSSVFDSSPPRGVPLVEFSSRALEEVRSLLLKKQIGVSGNELVESPPLTIALSRSSTTRNIQNSAHINTILKEYGFDLCELNLNFFRDQVRTFSQTRIVVAAGGAALANIIFMPAGSFVIVMRSWRNSKLGIWTKLAKAMGVNCIEVTGMPTYFGPGKLRRMHSDFYISPRKLRKVLASVTASTTR
jgi:capsular polysaccharide biosynthesis protein